MTRVAILGATGYTALENSSKYGFDILRSRFGPVTSRQEAAPAAFGRPSVTDRSVRTDLENLEPAQLPPRHYAFLSAPRNFRTVVPALLGCARVRRIFRRTIAWTGAEQYLTRTARCSTTTERRVRVARCFATDSAKATLVANPGCGHPNVGHPGPGTDVATWLDRSGRHYH